MAPLLIHIRFVLFLSLTSLLFFNGCAGSTLDSQKETPRELVQKAMTYIRVDNYSDAKVAVNAVLEDYPDSPERVIASLLKAEIHYKQGEYEQSKFMFKGFMELYPAHRLVDRASFFLAMSDFRLMDIETRDQTNAQNALEEFDNFLKEFPNSKYRPQALVKRKQCIKSLARNQMAIGKFYFRTSSFHSAISRFQKLLSAYPDQPFLDEVLFLLGESYYSEQNFEAAKTNYHELIRKYPRSEFVKEARARLRKIQ